MDDENDGAMPRVSRLYPPPSRSLDAATRFLNRYFFDESWEEAKQGMTGMAVGNPVTLLAGLAGLEDLLTDSATGPGTLPMLVAWYADWQLEDSSDAGAKAWLWQVVETVREVLGDRQPPRPTHNNPLRD